MNRALYIGIYTDGSTSKMRADIIRHILNSWEFQILDTDIPKQAMSRLWQSIGFRYKIGPLIEKVNNYILSKLLDEKYDLIWVDKAIYITPKTTKILRNKTKCLVHFTPDPAFTFHKSRLFYKSLFMYDFAVTTKKFEINDYYSVLGKQKVIYCTQGFDKAIHRPVVEFAKKKGLCFLGHYETEREHIMQQLLDNDIDIVLAGINWEDFVKRNNHNNHLFYFGKGVYGENYVHTISSSLMSWGSISKWIPEMHTTRTFEIPACGTALLTERNEETTSFFNEDEAIFYSSIGELIEKVKYYMAHLDELRKITENGYKRVLSDGRDYESILRNVLKRIL